MNIEDLYPTRDFGFQMTDESILESENSEANKTIVKSQRPEHQERFPVIPEKEKGYSNSQLESKLVSSSSTLSEGFCLSLLGKRCASPKQKIRYNSEENTNNIGSIFSKNNEPEEFSRSVTNKRPNKSVLSTDTEPGNRSSTKRNSFGNSEIAQRTSFDFPTKEQTDISKPQTKKKTVTGNNISQSFVGKNSEPENSVSFVPNKTLDYSVGILDSGAEKILNRNSLGSATIQKECVDSPINEEPGISSSQIQNRAIDDTNIPQFSYINPILEDSSTNSLSDVPIISPTNDKTTTKHETKESETSKRNSKDISQQTLNPSILKSTLPSPSEALTPANVPTQMSYKGRGNFFAEAERDNNYRVPAERQKIILTSDKILQTSDNNLFQPPCSCTTDTTDYNSTTPQQDSRETPDQSAFVSTPHETSSTTWYCSKCHSPLSSKPKDNFSKNFPRYRAKKSIRSSRSTSPSPNSRKIQRGRTSSHRFQPCEETRKLVRPTSRKSRTTRLRTQRKSCVCEGECRYYTKSLNTIPNYLVHICNNTKFVLLSFLSRKFKFYSLPLNYQNMKS